MTPNKTKSALAFLNNSLNPPSRLPSARSSLCNAVIEKRFEQILEVMHQVMRPNWSVHMRHIETVAFADRAVALLSHNVPLSLTFIIKMCECGTSLARYLFRPTFASIAHLIDHPKSSFSSDHFIDMLEQLQYGIIRCSPLKAADMLTAMIDSGLVVKLNHQFTRFPISNTWQAHQNHFRDYNDFTKDARFLMANILYEMLSLATQNRMQRHLERLLQRVDLPKLQTTNIKSACEFNQLDTQIRQQFNWPRMVMARQYTPNVACRGALR